MWQLLADCVICVQIRPSESTQFDFPAFAGPKGSRAEMEALWPHFNIRMGCELGRGFMLICSITLANAAVSPIILPFALWYFVASWIMWRYVILYVFERSSESGGMVC